MSVSIDIKNQIKRKIETCPSVQKVYGYEEVNPSGFPCVFVKATGMDGEFASNAENRRLYSYRILILFPLGQDIETPKQLNRLEYAENVVGTVVDEIINAMDTDIELEGSPVLFDNAADATWGTFPYEGGVAKAAELTLTVYTELVVV